MPANPAMVPVRICLSPDQRSLRLDFEPATPATTGQPVEAIIDIGEGGRLLGLEVMPIGGDEPLLIDVDAPAGKLSRAASVTVTLERDPDGTLKTLLLPRRGAGYEITYPSGNQ